MKDIEEIENQIKEDKIDSKHTEKKGNRLCDDKQRKKKRKKEQRQGKIKLNKKKIVITILAVLAAVILIIGIFAGTYIYKANGNLATAALNMAADVLGEDDPIFILVLGISEDIKAALTDTIILVGYNPDSQKAFMLSIPRDTFVGSGEAWASGYDKINALYQKGPEKTVEAVEKLTGIEIANYVIVKNSALPAIVSAIGEVQFDVPIDMDYDDPTQNLHIHLKAGVQMIDGNEAEQLLRFRHNNDGTSYPTEYGDNDYGRMRTQREFIKAVASHLVSGNNLSNVKQIGTAVFNNIETDMSLGKMLGYAPSAIKLDINGIRMEQLPGVSSKINNLWFYKHNSIETYDLINELLTELALDEKEMKDLYTPTKKTKSTISSKKNTDTTNTVSSDNKNKEQENANTTKAHEHSYSGSKVNVKATCVADGERVYTCDECGEKYSEKIPATGHSLETKETVSGGTTTITKTCKNEGCTYKAVSTTTDSQKENEDKEQNNKDEHEHTYTKTISTTPATCTSDGSKILECSSCGKTKTETIKATGHNIVGGVCQNSGCTYKEEHKHSYTETNSISPTCTNPGSKTMKCSCGDTKTETIPATGHNMAGGACQNSGCGYTESVPETPSEPQTPTDTPSGE